jgi:LacI family transcriptional regulator
MKKILKIGLMLNPSIGYERGITSGIAKYSNLHGPWSFYSIPGTGREALPHWPRWDLDGVVLTDKHDVEFVLAKKIPCISVLVREEIKGIPNVVPNNEEVGFLGAQYFIERGFKHFVFCAEEGIKWMEQRYEGFRRKIEDNGLNVSRFNVHNDKIAISERLELIDNIKSLPKPLAVLSANDRCGRQVVDMCKQADISVPEEVSVLGVDNDDFICGLCNPPLSSIIFNTENAGYDAAKRLDLMIEGKGVHGDNSNIFVQPMEIFQRQSTSLCAIEDSVVAEAISFIARNEKRPIQVNDVSDHTAVSAKMLQKKFKLVLGRSVHNEIRRVRADYIAKLLLETNLTVSEIAYSMGYSCDNHMSRFFQKVKGLTITQYRRRYRIGVQNSDFPR